ncbi:MAG: response regulator transcription factor [Ardenticatenaceae bacterium]|nr:response regulator transcription factor [Ardenticatenaceae bacterium]
MTEYTKKRPPAANPFKILLVEDEESTARMIHYYLSQEQFDLLHKDNGVGLLDTLDGFQPDVIILDIMLPGIDGLQLCRQIRGRSTVPILMLTARSLDIDKVTALEIGADDYLTKPFSPTELVARVKAMVRRTYQFNQSNGQSPVEEFIGSGRVKIHLSRHLATLDGQPLTLTPLEYKLLATLVQHPGWAYSRDHLLEKVWGYEEGVGAETVTVHVGNLRKKLGVDGESLIRTVRGIGYAYQEAEWDGD